MKLRDHNYFYLASFQTSVIVLLTMSEINTPQPSLLPTTLNPNPFPCGLESSTLMSSNSSFTCLTSVEIEEHCAWNWTNEMQKLEINVWNKLKIFLQWYFYLKIFYLTNSSPGSSKLVPVNIFLGSILFWFVVSLLSETSFFLFVTLSGWFNDNN